MSNLNLRTWQRPCAAAVASAALLLGGCQMPPASELFDMSPEAEGTGVAGFGLVRAVVIIAKYQATPRQREVAEQRARVAYRRIAARQEARPAAPEPREKPAAKRMEASAGRDKPAARAAEPSPKKKKKLPRYIAVDTEKDERTSPKAKKAVMIFDTEAQEVVGNSVYDVASAPPVGSQGKFETFSAEYVGTAGL